MALGMMMDFSERFMVIRDVLAFIQKLVNELMEVFTIDALYWSEIKLTNFEKCTNSPMNELDNREVEINEPLIFETHPCSTCHLYQYHTAL